MRGMTSGLALLALATFAGAPAHATEGKAAETALAEPAPVPGTLDYQLAALDKAPDRAQAPRAAAPEGSVDVAHRVVDAAGAFDGYMRRAAALNAGYKDAAFVRKAVDTSAGYEATQLQQGAIAYGALVAMQDPMFVDAVNEAAPTPAARERLASELLSDPASVLRLPGAHETAQRVSQLVGRRGAALIAAGDQVRAASRSVQREAWSKAAISHPEAQLVAVKAQSAAHTTMAGADADALFTDLVSLRKAPAQSYPQAGRPTRAVAQSLAVAALAALGYGGEEHAAELEPLLSTGQGADCLKLAKLNLYQCLAVVGPQYEDMFCLGQHALTDTGQCVASTAGFTGPVDPEPVLVKASAPVEPALAPAPVSIAAAVAPPPPPAPPPASLAAPIALASLDGPERARAYADPVAAPPPPPLEAAPLPPPSVQTARADMPSYADLPHDYRGGDVEADARADRATARYTRQDADDDVPPAPRPRYAYARYEAPGGDGGAPQGSARYTWDPADGPPPAAPAGWRRPAAGYTYGGPYGDDR